MKLGYSNYALKELDVFECLPRLREIGYEAVEIAVREGWSTAPDRLDREDRSRLARLLKDLSYPPPPLMAEFGGFIRGEENRWAEVENRFEAMCGLARDLNFGDGPAVVTSTLGHCPSPWEETKEAILKGALRMADLAAGYGVTLALEPHVGNELDTPKKAVWLMEAAGHDHLRLNFDMSHFWVQGFDLEECVDLCAPYAVHTHIKDGRMVDGRVQFLLPGEGSLDLASYFLALNRAGIDLPVTVEVSAMIWTREDYNPWTTAEGCYHALAKAWVETGLSDADA